MTFIFGLNYIYQLLIFVILGILSFCTATLIRRVVLAYAQRPLSLNCLQNYIPTRKINQGIIHNKDGSFTSILKLQGSKYFLEPDLKQAKIQSYEKLKRILNLKDLRTDMQVKFLFKRGEKENKTMINTKLRPPISLKIFENLFYLEITSSCLQSLEEISRKFVGHFDNSLLLEDFDLFAYCWETINLSKVPFKSLPSFELDHYLANVSLKFFKELGYIRGFYVKKYCTCFSISFGDTIDSTFFNALMESYLNLEFIIHSKFLTLLQARSKMNSMHLKISASHSEEKRSILSSFFGKTTTKKVQELHEVEELLNNKEATLTLSDLTIFLYVNDPKDLPLAKQNLQDIVSHYDISFTEELECLNFFYLQRFPGFQLDHALKGLAPETSRLLYAEKILSHSLAGMFDMEYHTSGLSNCDWGNQPLGQFLTHNNNYYNFFLHVNENPASLAHSVIIAPSGGGKTTFFQYIVDGALGYEELDVYLFDRFDGMRIFTEYSGGTNLSFEEGLAFNPLQIDLSLSGNKIFLLKFLSMLCSPTTEEKILLQQAIDCFLLLPLERRILKDMVSLFFPPALRKKFFSWTEGEYATYFNASHDGLTFQTALTTFQMNNILKDDVLCAPLMYYIMFRIRQKCSQGRPHLIFIDEAAAMLKNPLFLDEAEVLLQEHRKLRGSVNLAFQNPQSFLKTPALKELIINQCQNILLLTSDAMDESVLKQLNIDTTYFEQLQQQKHTNHPYWLLLKRPQEHVILDINMQDLLGENLKFLSSSSDQVVKMKEMKKTHGELWVEYF